METLRNFIRKIFRKKISEHVYLFCNNLIYRSSIKKFLCFEYFLGDSREIIKQRITHIFSIEDNFSEYKIYVKRNNKKIEYNDDNPIQIEKYDQIVLEILK